MSDVKACASRLRRILEDSAALKVGNCTTREVESLREAFNATTKSIPPGQLTALVTQCDNVLWQLETKVRSDPHARTGDEDRELVGKEIYQFRNIPRRRRLQTLVVTCLCFFTAVPTCLAVFFFLLFQPLTMPFMLAYVVWMIISRPRHPMKRRPWITNLEVFKVFRDYFPVRLVVPRAVRKAINPAKNYIFCYHPHGVHSFGAMGSFATNANDIERILPGINIHVQTLGINFLIPFWRELGLNCGFGDASASCIRKTLASGRGESVLLVIGGAEESLLASPKTNDLLLSKRKGFVKIALQSGSPLVPVFGFGETNVYGNWAEGRPRLQQLLKRVQKTIGFALPLVKGRTWFTYSGGLLPHRRQIVTIVGAPLEVPRIASPTASEIDEWHKKYCECLMQLYREHKDVYDLSSFKKAEIVS